MRGNQNDSHIVSITAMRFSNEIPDNAITMNGFTLSRKDRGNSDGGVAIFAKFNIRCKILTVPDLSNYVIEMLWLQIRPCRHPRAVSSILIAVVTTHHMCRRLWAILIPTQLTYPSIASVNYVE